MMDHKPLKSSNLTSCAYHDGVMEVRFTNGSTYRASGVSKEHADGIHNASSAGKYHHSVLKSAYKWEKVR